MKVILVEIFSSELRLKKFQKTCTYTHLKRKNTCLRTLTCNVHTYLQLILLQDKKKLILMATNSTEGKALYQSFVGEACRNIVHILEDIPSCKPPLDHVCELLPRLQPRYYSISSSPKVKWHTVTKIKHSRKIVK